MTENTTHTALAGLAQPEQLQRRILRRFITGLIATNFLIGSIFATLFYNTETEQLENKLRYEFSLQVSALDSEILRLKNIAAQITSRRHIRMELARYANNQTDKESVTAITRPTLEDAIQKSPGILGINRLDRDGQSLLSVGATIAKALWPQNFRQSTIQLGLPGLTTGSQAIVLSAPILSQQGQRIGTDIIAFDASQIQTVVKDFILRRGGQGIAIIVDRQNPTSPLFSSADDESLSAIELTQSEITKSLSLAHSDIHTIETSGVERLLIYQSLNDSEWVFVFTDRSDNVYAAAQDNAVLIVISISLLSLIGVALILVLIRPLTARNSNLIDRLTQLGKEQETLLKSAQDNEQRFQSILDNTPSIIYLKDKTGNYLLVNKAFEQANDLSAQDVVGKSDYQIHDSFVANNFSVEDKRVVDTGQLIQIEETIHHADGPHDYATVKFPMTDIHGEIFAICGISTDITQRKAAEAALMQSENRYRNLVENTHDWIWEVDTDIQFTYTSPRIIELLGYEPGEVIAHTPFELMTNGSAQRVSTIFKSISDQRKPFHSLESTYLHKDGSEVVIETNGEPIFNADGKFSGFRGSNRDITDRKKLEGRERVRLMVLEKMAQGDAMENILNTLVTQGEVEMSGTRCSVLVLDESTKRLRNFSSPGMDKAYNKAIDGIELGNQAGPLAAAIEQDQQILVENLEQYPYWETYTRLAHRADVVACCAQPIHDSHGQVLGVLGIFFREACLPSAHELKLTLQIAQLAGLAIEQHTNESALKSSEQRFNLAMSASNDGLWDWDLQTDVLYYSPRWKAMLGYAADELDNHIASWERLMDADDLIRAKSAVTECFRKGEKNFTLEFRMRHKYGHWVYILSRALILYNDDEQAVRIVGTHVDISEHKQLEQKLRDSEANLLQERDFINAMIESAPSIIIVLDRHGRIIRFNHAAEQVTGFSFAELHNQPVWEQLIPVDVRDRVQQVFENLKAGDIQARYQNQWLMKDGSKRMFDWHNSVIYDENDLVTHIISQGYPISESEETYQ